MRRILTEAGVAKIRRFGREIVSNWEMLLAKLIKVGLFKKEHPGYFVQKRGKKKKAEYS